MIITCVLLLVGVLIFWCLLAAVFNAGKTVGKKESRGCPFIGTCEMEKGTYMINTIMKEPFCDDTFVVFVRRMKNGKAMNDTLLVVILIGGQPPEQNGLIVVK